MERGTDNVPTPETVAATNRFWRDRFNIVLESKPCMPALVCIVMAEHERTHYVRFQQMIHTFFPTIRLITVATGYDVLVAYQRERPNLIIIDTDLPDIHGTDLITHLRTTGTTMPILLLTAGTPDDLQALDPHTVYVQKTTAPIAFVDILTSALIEATPTQITATQT